MAFFSRLFRATPKKDIAVLIDIGSDSVGGAYAALPTGAQPVIHHTIRVPMQTSGSRPAAREMETALVAVLKSLIEQGAPAMRRAEGSARPDKIVVSIGAPWQQTAVRTEHVARPDGREFVFTHDAMEEAVARSAAGAKEHILTEEMVTGILLNGYETTAPFGKRARYADLAILSSHIEEEIALRVHTMLREAFHTRAVRLLSGTPVCYGVLRDVFAHEHDFLTALVTSGSVDLTLVKQGIPYDVISVQAQMHPLLASARAMADTASEAALAANRGGVEMAWVEEMRKGLGQMRARHPLPRTIFLVAPPSHREILTKLLDASVLRALWLSDRPLSIVPLAPSHLSSYVSMRTDANADLPLAMLALYARNQTV